MFLLHKRSVWTLVLCALAAGCSGGSRDTKSGGSLGPDGQGGTPGGSGSGNGNGAGLDGGGAPGGSGAEGCGVGCVEDAVGAGTKDGFDLTKNPNDGVAIDADGSIVIAREDGDQANKFIWIANTGANPPTVSKVDTTSLKEVARYAVGARDPSRTSVSISGDAYVGSRDGKGLTKISALGSKCPDTNKDGVITTSTGPDDVLEWGKDDCVLWFSALDEQIRGVAAQDVPGKTTITEVADGEPIITTTASKHYVWAGGGNKNKVFKLDGETGAVLLTTEAPRGVYGLALDGRGRLWITGGAYWDGSLASIDTTRCVDDASCNVTTCESECNATKCPSTCDDAIKSSISLAPSSAYGITVDCKQRVWLGGFGGPILRYDPSAGADKRLTEASFDTDGTHGIAADAKGFIWGANLNRGVVRIDAEDLSQGSVISDAQGAKGVAVDADGKIWAITQGDSAHVIDPGATLTDNTVVVDAVTDLDNPYTYSDMTGQQLRFATDQPSTYRQAFEGCASGETSWRDFAFEVETPPDTNVVFRARTAETTADLEAAEWMVIGGAPFGKSPVSLAAALARYNKKPGKLLEIEAQLLVDDRKVADRCSGIAATTPRIKRFSVTHSCEPQVQ